MTALAGRTGVDEVVVIVAGRNRRIPGTSLALDAEVAARVWEVYLRRIPNARVEVASHSAIDHALADFHRASRGDRLLFSIGESDPARGDERFDDLAGHAARTGVEAETVAAPTGSLAVRATGLREALAAGDAGRDWFVTALPAVLSAGERGEVWSICRGGMREISHMVEQTLESFRPRDSAAGLAPLHAFRQSRPGVPRAACERPRGDHQLRRRYRRGGRHRPAARTEATPAPGSGAPGHQAAWIGVGERRRSGGVARGARIRQGDADPGARRSRGHAGRFVPGGGTGSRRRGTEGGPVSGAVSRHDRRDGLWGSETGERRHWSAVLEARTGGMPEAFAECPARLRSESAQAARRGFFHLELSPRHILGGVRTGIVDLELASSFGDPALDLGYLLGVCLRYRRGAEAAGEILRGYREAAAHSWSGMERRTVAFAACTLVRTGEDARLADARMLLDRGL